MREIGGYFGFEELIHHEYYPSMIALNTARYALLYLIKARGIKKIHIPSYLCSSVSGMLDREGHEYELYHISENFMPKISNYTQIGGGQNYVTTLSEGEYLYVVNYYGRISKAEISSLKARYHNIILDNVQAFFQTPIDGIDTIYSCRKFFGVPDGAYLSSDVRLEHEIPTDKSFGRMKHILGRCEGRSASDYYGDFRRSDESYAALPMMKMSWLTHNLLGAIDYERVRRKREENYRVLNSILGPINKLPEIFPDGPYAYPFYCNAGMEMKKKLAEKKIFVATIWPNALTCGDPIAEDYAANILPLPCDQRYDSDDMKHIAEEVMRLLQTTGA